jgi:hypothetical protein
MTDPGAAGRDDDPLAGLPERPPARRRRPWSRLAGLFGRSSRSRRAILALVLFLPPAVLLYYLIGGILVHAVDDDTAFAAPAPPEGGSRALAMARALIEREVDGHGWAANDPFFMPTWALDDMPNYQRGLIAALGTVLEALAERTGDGEGLSAAAELLAYPGDRWVIDLDASWTPVAPAEARYREAAETLAAVNVRLAEGAAGFGRDARTLSAILSGVAADLGASADRLALHLAEAGGWPLDNAADDLFYEVKGRLYAHRMLLEQLRRDIPGPVENAGRRAAWQEMLDSLDVAAGLDPWIVVGGGPDGPFLSSHLTAQGFFLMRARSRMLEIAGALEG